MADDELAQQVARLALLLDGLVSLVDGIVALLERRGKLDERIAAALELLAERERTKGTR